MALRKKVNEIFRPYFIIKSLLNAPNILYNVPTVRAMSGNENEVLRMLKHVKIYKILIE